MAKKRRSVAKGQTPRVKIKQGRGPLARVKTKRNKMRGR